MNPIPPIPALRGPAAAAEHHDRRARLWQRWAGKTQPLGALGRLQDLAVTAAVAQRRDAPDLQDAQLLVCAADHGLAAQGVSAYPAEVTRQMVANMLAGGAAVSVLAEQHGLALTIADCGVRGGPLPAHPRLVALRCGEGTADASAGPAMDEATARAAVANGAALVRKLPGRVLLLGEMGIANTSAASLLMARLTGLPLADCIGRGTGLDDAGLARKRQVLERVAARHAAARTPLAALAAFGGFEIATLAGAALGAASSERLVVVDGFITTAAIAVAAALEPALLDYCVFSHASAESGHARWLQALGVRPLLDLELRLGEGSGAALAWPLVVSACRLLERMASFDSAGVSDRAGTP